MERRGHGVAGQQRCVVGRRGAARGGVGRWEARSGRRAAGFGAPSIGLGMCDRSQMSAWLSSPAVLMWHDECGAHATELTTCEWPLSFAAGSDGTRMSRMTTSFESIVIVAR